MVVEAEAVGALEKFLAHARDRGFSAINAGAFGGAADEFVRVAAELGYETFERAGGSWIRLSDRAKPGIR